MQTTSVRLQSAGREQLDQETLTRTLRRLGSCQRAVQTESPGMLSNKRGSVHARSRGPWWGSACGGEDTYLSSLLTLQIVTNISLTTRQRTAIRTCLL